MLYGSYECPKCQTYNQSISYRLEWNEELQSTSRLSEYLYFLRGRGKTLLENFISSNESTTNDDFHHLLLRILACLAPLSLNKCAHDLVDFVATSELTSHRTSSTTKKKTHSRSNSNHGVQQEKVLI